MKSPLIIANWKSNKTVKETKEWFSEIAAARMPSQQEKVVLCPPFPLLALCKQLIQQHQLDWELGAQDISQFTQGKHTGDVNSVLLKDFVTHVLIGHSERRQELHETDTMLFEKSKRVLEAGLTPIFFVQGEDTPIPPQITIVAYEPVFAIGTGHPDSPENVEKVASHIKQQKHIQTVLYGGSVNSENVRSFISCPSISGIVPGTASLSAEEFSKLLQNA